MGSVVTAQLCHNSTKAVIGNTQINKHDYVAMLFYLWKQRMSWIWPLYQSVLTAGVGHLLTSLVSEHT